MLSVYHDLNGKLTMTHYCMLRNQPRMKLVKSTVPCPNLNHDENSIYAIDDRVIIDRLLRHAASSAIG